MVSARSLEFLGGHPKTSHSFCYKTGKPGAYLPKNNIRDTENNSEMLRNAMARRVPPWINFAIFCNKLLTFLYIDTNFAVEKNLDGLNHEKR